MVCFYILIFKTQKHFDNKVFIFIFTENYIKMAEEVPYWKQQMLEAQEKKEMKEKYPDLGKIVKLSGEYGVIVLNTHHEGNEEIKEQVVRWDTPREFDNEQYESSPFQYEFIDNYEFKYINMDGTLKEQFKKS